MTLAAEAPHRDPALSRPPQPRAARGRAARRRRVAGPLLIIAGAGTGKTDTLVHQLAHLVSSGADPRRILLMTFSRRAAAEMTRRAARIAAEAAGPRAALLADGLPWAGTFHAVGARLLRDHAPAVGLDPDFTIHDREDSADLMNLARHRARPRRHRAPLPGQGHLPRRSTPARSTPRRTSGRVLRDRFPWCAGWEAELRALFAAYAEAKQAMAVLDYDDLLLYWAGMMQDAGPRRPRPATRFDHVLVDEYQDTNRLQAAILAGAEARRPRRHRRRRRRPVDLRLPRRARSATSSTSRRASTRRPASSP